MEKVKKVKVDFKSNMETERDYAMGLVCFSHVLKQDQVDKR